MIGFPQSNLAGYILGNQFVVNTRLSSGVTITVLEGQEGLSKGQSQDGNKGEGSRLRRQLTP